jgi:hypothetical protein
VGCLFVIARQAHIGVRRAQAGFGALLPRAQACWHTATGEGLLIMGCLFVIARTWLACRVPTKNTGANLWFRWVQVGFDRQVRPC